jgi:hypothetical protein
MTCLPILRYTRPCGSKTSWPVLSGCRDLSAIADALQASLQVAHDDGGTEIRVDLIDTGATGGTTREQSSWTFHVGEFS